MTDFYVSDFYVKFFAGQNEESSNFALLKMSLPKEDEKLRELYKQHIEKHNKSMNIDLFPNSGFDLFVPENMILDKPFATKMIDHKIKCEMLYCDVDHLNKVDNCGYFMFPRSSLSKTPLMLANHTGIIDAGYRGNLMGAFRSFQADYLVEKETRLLQICHPSLCKIYVVMVEEEELSTTTRGDGGFGSTGLKGVAK
jgi:dUTP pyrophosphatase